MAFITINPRTNQPHKLGDYVTLEEIKQSGPLFEQFRHVSVYNHQPVKIVGIHGWDKSTDHYYRDNPHNEILVSLATATSQIKVMLPADMTFKLIAND